MQGATTLPNLPLDPSHPHKTLARGLVHSKCSNTGPDCTEWPPSVLAFRNFECAVSGQPTPSPPRADASEAPSLVAIGARFTV